MSPESQNKVILEYLAFHMPTDLATDIVNALEDERTALWAMHEAEKTLTGAQALIYADELNRATKSFKHITPVIMCMATSSQRAEAFLRTIGKWVE